MSCWDQQLQLSMKVLQREYITYLTAIPNSTHYALAGSVLPKREEGSYKIKSPKLHFVFFLCADFSQRFRTFPDNLSSPPHHHTILLYLVEVVIIRRNTSSISLDRVVCTAHICSRRVGRWKSSAINGGVNQTISSHRVAGCGECYWQWLMDVKSWIALWHGIARSLRSHI